MTEFKGFRLGDVLYIKSSKKAIHKNNITNFKGEHPYVTRTSRNNGIDSLIDYDTEFLNEGNTISLGLDTYVINYQVRPYFTGNKVKILENANLNKYNSIYLITNLDKVFQPYSWGTGIDLKVLSDLVITLPVKSLTDTEPDWEYMEQYIKQIEKKAILLVKEQNEKDIVLLKELVGQDEGSDISEDVELREFKLGSIFEIKNGRRVTKSQQIAGVIPYVTASTENNGIDTYIGNPPFIANNILTVNFFGNTYYHPYDVSYKDGTYGLKLINDTYSSKEVYLYMLSVIEKTTLNLGSYSKMLTGNIMSDTKIKLPVNKEVSELVPDWTTIEEYMKHIQQKYILLKEQNNIEELNNLLSVTGMTHDSLALDSKDLVLDQILETLISWEFMESQIAKIELDLKIKLSEKLSLMLA